MRDGTDSSRYSLRIFIPGAHAHGFGGCCTLVEQGCIGHLQSSHLGHHRLEVEQGLQASLGDFRLIGRVLRGPARILEDVPHDGVRYMAIVVAQTDVRSPDLVHFGDAAYPGDKFVFI